MSEQEDLLHEEKPHWTDHLTQSRLLVAAFAVIIVAGTAGTIQQLLNPPKIPEKTQSTARGNATPPKDPPPSKKKDVSAPPPPPEKLKPEDPAVKRNRIIMPNIGFEKSLGFKQITIMKIEFVENTKTKKKERCLTDTDGNRYTMMGQEDVTVSAGQTVRIKFFLDAPDRISLHIPPGKKTPAIDD